ncbi:MAG: protein NO VEIN domain-containing protein [Pseudonocardiaceae bacterium]
MGELTSNKAVEDAAIKWVVELERAAGRLAEDVRFQGSAGDVKSPPRVIEVKAVGRSHRGEEIWLEPRQVEEAERNPDFFVYVVENVRQGDPALFTLRVLGGADLRRLLGRKKQRHYFSVPWPVAAYDSMPLGLR